MNGDDFRMIEPMFEWVDRDQSPFLMVLITSVAHDPYELPAWYQHEPKPDRYEQYLETVRYTDAFVGEVRDQLERRGLSDNTLLCMIGDHGETFRPESPRGRWTPFEETIRVPWVIRWPGRVEAGTRIDWPCSQLDVTPTILSLMGFGIDDAAFDGAIALDPIDPDRRLYFSAWYRNSPIGYVQGMRKLIYWPYTDSLFEYDLAADPGEESPRTLNGLEKERAIAEIQQWQKDSRLKVEARRFRERVLYDHWRAFSSGRSAWAYYVP
jgi:choline-sulfatase